MISQQVNVHTFLDDIVGAIAAAASSRLAHRAAREDSIIVVPVIVFIKKDGVSILRLSKNPRQPLILFNYFNNSPR